MADRVMDDAEYLRRLKLLRSRQGKRAPLETPAPGSSVLDVPIGGTKRIPDTVLRRRPEPEDTITGISPSMAQRHAEGLAGYLTPKIGGPRAQKISQTLLGGPESALPFDLGVQELVPFSPYVAEQAGEMVREGQETGSPLTTGLGLGLGALQAYPVFKPIAKGVQAGAMAAGRAGERLAERVVPQVMERGGLGAEMLGAMGTGTRSPLDVWHGSPHKFDPEPGAPLGQFRAEKIGTGEGAQAYGHGLYTAEAPGVAKTYQGGAAVQVHQRPKTGEWVGQALDPSGLPLGKQVFKTQEEAQQFAQGIADKYAKAGYLYKVDLPDEMIPKMLDWDKPLKEQEIFKSGLLREIAEDVELPVEYQKAALLGERTGEDLYHALGGGKGASAYLSSWKVPGIKYLDEQSRGASGTGKWRLDFKDGTSQEFNFKPNDDVLEKMGATATPIGTRNFVIFPGEEKKLRILQRNEEKLPDEQKQGVSYVTAQEGPFFRVSNPQLSGFAHRGIREAPGEGAAPSAGGVGGQLPQSISDEAVRSALNDPNNFVKKVAEQYSQRVTGQPYVLPKIPESSLLKQSPVGRVFQLAATDNPAYKSAVFEQYAQKFPQVIEQSGAKNYDELVEASYRQLAKESKQQFESLPVNMSFHRAGEGNYVSSNEMLKDVYGNRHLYVFQGGDPHPFMNQVDPATNLNANEMFRAVHDFYGHAIHGNQFGPKGEEIAFAAHSQMFSPLARFAMATETRGQNSVVNYTPLNAALKARIAKLDEIEYEAKRRKDLATVEDVRNAKKQAWESFQFAPQKGLLLPPEFLDVQYAGGMPSYVQPLITPDPGTAVGSELVHFSKAPGLTQTDPRRYGEGIKGAEAERLSYIPGAVKERTYFYAGDPQAITPEPGLGPHRYRGSSEQLYDVAADPLNLRTLAAETSRTPFSSQYNPGMANPEQAITDVERMVREYGYEGMLNPKLTKPSAIMFKPTQVKPFKDGGFVQDTDALVQKLIQGGMSEEEAMTQALRMAGAREEARMAGGGLAKAAGKAIGKAAQKAEMNVPVTAARDLTTVNDFRTSLLDRVRIEVEKARQQMETFDYKYDKGQRVFTQGSAEKNMPPYTIISRTRVGNVPMREDPKNLLSKTIKDPETGKAKRTPYEPGYRVRMERAPGEFYEYDIPQSQIIGEVEMQAGGLAKTGARVAESAAKKTAIKAAAPSETIRSIIEQANSKLAEDAAKNNTKVIASPNAVANTITKMADEIAKSNPKLSEADVAKRAQRQALAKLKWERGEKPAIEQSYGALSKAGYDAPKAKRMRNVPEVVEERIKRSEEFLAQPTEAWKPPPPELQAFDRALIKDALEGFPGIEQTRFPRYEPARANVGYIDEIYDDPRNQGLIEKQIKRGLPLGGETFYASLYPVKVAALERGIPAEKFDKFIYETAPASARNSIMNEMAVGQFLRNMNARGLPLDEQTVTQEMARFKDKYGTGLPLMPVHREGVRQIIEGGQNMRDLVKADIPTNYKIPTYGTQKAGDFGKSVVLDVHEAAGETLGSRYHPYFTEQGGFGPTEYGLAEGKMLDIANRLGIPGGMAQAGRWFGGGELTGLKSPRGDALDLLERQVAYTMQGQGLRPTPKMVREYVLDMIESGRGVLMPYFKSEAMPDYRVLKKKDGGAVTPEGAEDFIAQVQKKIASTKKMSNQNGHAVSR